MLDRNKASAISCLLVALMLVSGGAGESTDTEIAKPLRLFTNVLSIIQERYVDDVAPKDLIDNAINGILRRLDPHSSFLDADSYQQFQVETSGSFGGVGIEVTVREGVLTVVSAIEGTPAFRAGVRPGDRIVTIDDFTPNGRSIDGTGLTPDVIVEAAKPPVGAGGPPLTLDTARDLKDDPQLQRAIEILRASTALRVRLRRGQ